MQNYFGLAIRQNMGDLSAMKKSVTAVLTHCCKNNEDENDKDDVEELRHMYCPRGEESWCRWQRNKVTGKNTYKGTLNLPTVIKKLLKPIFVDLSSDNLLSVCMDRLRMLMKHTIKFCGKSALKLHSFHEKLLNGVRILQSFHIMMEPLGLERYLRIWVFLVVLILFVEQFHVIRSVYTQ